MINLKDKTALVTGGSQGIGKAIALILAKAGADIVIWDVNLEKANEIVKEIEKLGRKASAYKVDVSNSNNVNNTAGEVLKEHQKIDILVNNAGITKDMLLMKLSEESWDAVININLKGTFLVTKAFLRQFLKLKSGKIINISSVVGLSGNAGQTNYSASKAGIVGFTQSVAKEVGTRNINVNAIAPGFIETEMSDAIPEKAKDTFIEKIPLRKAGSVDDVANTVLFLSSSLSDYITGQVIVVDGGMLID